MKIVAECLSPLPEELPTYADAIIYHGCFVPEEAIRLAHIDKPAYRYLNILTLPEPSWSDPLLDVVRQFVPPLTAPDGRPAIYPWYNHVQLWGWNEVSGDRLVGLCEALLRVVPIPLSLDLYFPDLQHWMFDPSGPQLTDFPEAIRTSWHANLDTFMGIVNAKLTNCSRYKDTPRYFEAIPALQIPFLMECHSRDIYSVRADDALAVRMLTTYACVRGAAISFTGAEAPVSAAYTAAVTARRNTRLTE